MQSLDGGKPEIHYPCTWSYKVIGVDESALRYAIAEVVGEATHRLSIGNASSGGKYVSLGLELDVCDEQQRLGVFQRLASHPAVSFVI